MKWIARLVGNKGFWLFVLNVFVIELVAMVAKAFTGDVSVFAGCGFVAGFVALIVEWCILWKEEDVPLWCVAGTMAGAVAVYVLGC